MLTSLRAPTPSQKGSCLCPISGRYSGRAAACEQGGVLGARISTLRSAKDNLTRGSMQGSHFFQSANDLLQLDAWELPDEWNIFDASG